MRGPARQREVGPTVTLKVAEALTDEQMAYIALRENADRKNLTPAEECRC